MVRENPFHKNENYLSSTDLLLICWKCFSLTQEEKWRKEPLLEFIWIFIRKENKRACVTLGKMSKIARDCEVESCTAEWEVRWSWIRYNIACEDFDGNKEEYYILRKWCDSKYICWQGTFVAKPKVRKMRGSWKNYCCQLLKNMCQSSTEKEAEHGKGNVCPTDKKKKSLKTLKVAETEKGKRLVVLFVKEGFLILDLSNVTPLRNYDW